MIYDLVILGGGPGGYRAAELAGREGLKVLVVEKDKLGGTCLNRGCIPTKAYYVDVIDNRGPVAKMWSKKEEIVQKLRKGISIMMDRAGADVLYGTASIGDIAGDVKNLEVETDSGVVTVSGKKLIIATGAHSMGLDFDSQGLPDGSVIGGDWAVTDPELWDPERNEAVKTVAITGAGVISVEMAGMLKAMGKEVIMLKHSDQILRRCDGDIKKKVKQQVKRSKIKTYDYFKLERVESSDGRLLILGKSKDDQVEFACDRIILASSMVPNLEGYGLENSGVEFTPKGIVVDSHMRTSLDGVYAIGDCTGGMMLAHLAEYQALSAVENMTATGSYVVDSAKVPYCIFFNPEIAAVGMTEEEAAKDGIAVKVGKAYFASNGMALAMGHSDGFVKVISSEESGVILGVHMIGPDTASLIAEAALAVDRGMTVKEVAYSVHSHPTLAECFKDALFRILES